MTGVLKKGMLVLVVVFIGFYMFTAPSGLAQTTKDGVGALWKALTSLRERWGDVHARTELDELAEQVVAGRSDPYAAADELLATFTD